MQKKLLAAAVAGAMGAPVAAFAQTSTVQIFGTMYAEYTIRADQGRSAAGPELSNADFIQTPGSQIGFKGEEKLGGGLSAWFQCTSTADLRGQSQAGWCSRNSAVGLKGGFGNVFIGNWDTPFKRTIAPGNVGSNDTGIWGTAFLLKGGSTTTTVGGTRGTFSRRQNNSINYDSPSWGGFRVMAAVTSSQPSTATFDAATNNKPRVMSLGAQYSSGPIFVSAGYERHNDFNGPSNVVPPVAGTPRSGDDTGWHVSAAYTWGPVRVGGSYTEQEFETGTVAAPTNLEYRAYHVGVDWKIVGPHGLRAGYTVARDVKGTPGAAGVVGSGVTRPGVPAAGTPNNTGAELWNIFYTYRFSKRTEFRLGYSKLENEAGAAYRLGGLGTAIAAGEDQDAWALAVRHTF